MTPWADVIVVGGGIVGAAAARALARAGRRVLLVERGGRGGEATDASAGMLAAQVEAHAGDPLLPLALRGRDAYRRLFAELPLDVAHRIGYHPTGILQVALDEAEAAELAAQGEAQRGLGLRAEWLDGPELARRHPGVARCARGALLAPEDGYVHTTTLAAALRALAYTEGATIVTGEATRILTRAGRVTGVRTTAGSWRCRWAVIAAGAWSPQLEGLPRPLPVEPVRGQMLLVDAPADWNPQVLFRPNGYVVPREGRVALGATMEHAGFDAAPTAQGLAVVRAACAQMVPALAEAPARAAWAGLRPMTPDGLPILGHDPEVEGLLYGTGHGRNGILLGPLTGEILRDLAEHGETASDLRPYSIARFRKLSAVR